MNSGLKQKIFSFFKHEKPIIGLAIFDDALYAAVFTGDLKQIVVKKKIGKLRPPRGWKEDVKASGFEILPISLEHIYPLENLPLYHKDPFDRMLVAQAKVEDLTLITNDKKIWKYKIDVLKA